MDLKGGGGKFVGQLTQHRVAGTSFVPSPDFRFAFNKPSTATFTNLVYLLDMQEKKLTAIHIDGWAVGWWNNTDLMFLTRSNDVFAYDVRTGRTNCVLPFTNITAFLDRVKIAYSTGTPPRPYLEWNGREFEILITDVNGPWNQEPTFLLRYDRKTSRFDILAREFQPEWSSHFDATLKHYVFSGKISGHKSDGVFLREVATGKEVTLVPATGAKSFSIPNIYGDRVIYIRSNALWSVSFDGKTNERLFPP